MTAFFAEGEYETLKRERRIRKQLSRLKDHVIVCGADDVATGVVERLVAEKVACAVMDADGDRINNLRELYPSVASVTADPTKSESLERLGLATSRGLISALGDDRLNLIAIVSAKQSRSDLRVLSRSATLDSAARLKPAGADAVVCTPYLVGVRAASQLIRPTALQFVDLFLQGESKQHVVARGIEVGQNSSVTSFGQLLGDDLPAVLAVRRSGQSEFEYNLAPEAVLRPGDRLSMIGDPVQLAKAESLLTGQLASSRSTLAPSVDTSSDAGEFANQAAAQVHKYVVCGIGDTGLQILNEMQVSGRACVGIELSQARVRQLAEQRPDLRIIHGDAQDPAILRQADLENACGLATALPTERDNLVVVVTAKQIQPKLRVVSSVGSPHDEPRLMKAGAEVASRSRIGGRRLVAELLRPGVATFINQLLVSARSVRFEAVVCREQAPLTGHAIVQHEIHRQCGLRIIALRRSNQTEFVPNPSALERFEPGMTLVVAGESSQVDRLVELVGDWE